MIIHDVTQGEVEWDKLRLGNPTTSQFHRIIKTCGGASDQRHAYENALVAEQITGTISEDFKGTSATERGHRLEPEAVAYYELTNDVDTKVVGFVTNDDMTVGCSPDRFVGEDGLLEIKCPEQKGFITTLLRKPESKVQHFTQVQGQLFICEKKWVDLFFYHPDEKLPNKIIRVERDPVFLEALEERLNKFIQNVKTKKEQILNRKV